MYPIRTLWLLLSLAGESVDPVTPLPRYLGDPLLPAFFFNFYYSDDNRVCAKVLCGGKKLRDEFEKYKIDGKQFNKVEMGRKDGKRKIEVERAVLTLARLSERSKEKKRSRRPVVGDPDDRFSQSRLLVW